MISTKVTNSNEKKDAKISTNRSESLNESAYETIEDFIIQVIKNLFESKFK